MMISSRALLAGLALVAVGTIGNAQAMTTRTFDTLGHASYDLTNGTVTRGQAEKTAILIECFNNTDTTGFFATGTLSSTLGNPVEWLDWGLWCGTGGGTGSDIVGEFVFGYATSVTDTILGGTGANATLRFYDGIVGNCLDAGTGNAPIATFTLDGLPGADGIGGISGWLIAIDLSGGDHFTNGGAGTAFGFSWNSTDDNGAGAWATGPLLCLAGDPLGTSGDASIDPDANGQVDAFDIYDLDVETGTCIGTFAFAAAEHTSWYLTVSTLDGGTIAMASATARNSAIVPNPANYAVLAPPIIGGSFVGSDLTSNGGIGVFVLGYATPLDFPTAAFGTVLINITDPSGQLLPPLSPLFDGGGVASFSTAIPNRLELCGLLVSTQTVEFGCGIQMHNAVDLIIGY